MGAEEPDNVDNQLLDGLMKNLALLELKERFKIKPENFATRLDLICYIMALQVVATDEDFISIFTGKPEFEPARDALQIAIKTVEILQKEFRIEILPFDVQNNVYYPPIPEKEVLEKIGEGKLSVMMFDRVIMEDSLREMQLDEKEVKELREGICLYISNMKTKKKGYKRFESDVKNVFQNSFIYDLIFTNPLMPEKNYDEFCDILITFYDSILVIQCKESALEDPERLTKYTIVEGLNQLKTSMNRAKAKSEKLFMVNSIRKFNDYNFTDVKDIYPILVVNRKLPFLDYNAIKNTPEIKRLDFVPIILSMDDLNFLISELDTPSDLFAYLKEREVFIENNTMPLADERELLSYYLMNGKSFESRYVGSRYGVLSGFHEEYKNGKLSELFAQKKELDKISYWVDDIMKGAYLSGEPNYLKAVEELLKLNRVQRRKLAQRAEEKRNKSIALNRGSWGLTVYGEKPEVAFVVYFTPEVNEETRDFFNALCMTAQYRTNVKKVVGLGQTTNKSDSKPVFNLGFYFEKIEDYSPEEEEDLEKLCDGFWGEASAYKYGEFTV